jgi:hypothetical protein
MMRFPPPVRFYAPLLVLVFGLATTWLEYELNLANDLARSLKDVEAQAAVTGDRLTKWGARQVEQGDPLLLAEDFAAWVHQPWLKEAALVDGNGVVIDDSAKQWIFILVNSWSISTGFKFWLIEAVFAPITRAEI